MARYRPGHDVRRLPWPSEVFVFLSFGCSVPAVAAVAAIVTASYCSSNSDTAALADAAVTTVEAASVERLLQFLLTLLPLTLLL